MLTDDWTYRGSICVFPGAVAPDSDRNSIVYGSAFSDKDNLLYAPIQYEGDEDHKKHLNYRQYIAELIWKLQYSQSEALKDRLKVPDRWYADTGTDSKQFQD